MARPPMPIADLGRRLQEMGRIKIGVITEGTTKDGKKYTRPKAIDTFRFTSQDPVALAQVQGELGGEVVPYHHDKSTDTHELITDRNEVRIALPPDPLGGSPTYEEYSAGGRESCDGVIRECWRKGPDGPEPYEVDCPCAAKGELSCKVTTHLSVLLPMTRMSGLWRITTHSYNAALELPGMVDLIRSLQDRGLTRGILRIRDEVQVLGGVTRRFKVPTLGVDETAEALAAGAGMMGALPSVPVAISPPAVLQIEAGQSPAGSSGGGVPAATREAARPEHAGTAVVVPPDRSSGGDADGASSPGLDTSDPAAASSSGGGAADSPPAPTTGDIEPVTLDTLKAEAKRKGVTQADLIRQAQEWGSDAGTLAKLDTDMIGRLLAGLPAEKQEKSAREKALIAQAMRAQEAWGADADKMRGHLIAYMFGHESAADCTDAELGELVAQLVRIKDGRDELWLRSNGEWCVRVRPGSTEGAS